MARRTRSALGWVGTAVTVLLLVLAQYGVVLWLLAGLTLPREPSGFSVVVATLVVALTVQPATRGLRRWWCRRLDVSVLGPVDLLRRLPGSVVAELPAEDIPRHVVRVLGEGLRADRTELWVRVDGGEHRLTAVWPEEGGPGAGGPPGTRSTTGGEASGVVELPVGDGSDEPVAVLVVEHRPARALSALERRLADGYAEQAGQVMRMLARRTALQDRRRELDRQQRALREARSQLERTREVERARIERDLHDGAQQHLLSLTMAVALARRLGERAPDRVLPALQRAEQRAEEVRRVLSDLAAGLYPRELDGQSLAVALRTALADNAVPVVVTERAPDGVAALTPEQAEALYFTALEATQNATRHAGATDVSLEVEHDAGVLVLRVRDNGSGFRPEEGGPGSGLAGIRRRLAAVGGELHLASAPGRGTVVTATVEAG